MSFFSTILDKLGLGKKEEKPAGAAAAATATAAAPAATPKPAAAETAKPATAASVATPKTGPAASTPKDDMERGAAAHKEEKAPAPTPVSEVDVVKKLEQMAEGSGLDWKVSIVDLLKVLGMDAGKDARIELAKELGCPAELIGGDYSKMNVWLHKEVLKRIAANGGNIPQNLLD